VLALEASKQHADEAACHEVEEGQDHRRAWPRCGSRARHESTDSVVTRSNAHVTAARNWSGRAPSLPPGDEAAHPPPATPPRPHPPRPDQSRSGTPS
jgi:hypothetical protein